MAKITLNRNDVKPLPVIIGWLLKCSCKQQFTVIATSGIRKLKKCPSCHAPFYMAGVKLAHEGLRAMIEESR